MAERRVWFSVETNWPTIWDTSILRRFAMTAAGQINEELAEEVASQHYVSDGYMPRDWPLKVRFYDAESGGVVIARFVVELNFHPVFRAERK